MGFENTKEVRNEHLDNNLLPDQSVELVDSFGREHTDMRVSLTDRCNFRCVYCMKEDQAFEPMKLEMTTPELLRSLNVARELGINSIRFTGGEPLIRKDATRVVRETSEMGFEDLAMTTNGSLLTRKVGATSLAGELKNAGLERINVSCDSLNPEKFEKIRRRGKLENVLAGIEEARRVGLGPIKMNVVLIKGINDDEILDFAEYARESFRENNPTIVRFIEYMPLGETGEKQVEWSPDKIVSSEEVFNIINEKWPLKIASNQDDHAPAARWEFADGQGQIGTIPTMTNPFCANCNRLRLTADRFLMPCLFSQKKAKSSLRNAIRHPEGATDEELKQIFINTVWSKKKGQDREIPDIYINPGAYRSGSKVAQGVTMSQIGG